MAQVRVTIELLTNILNESGCSKLKAEIFRLSKFDKDEATLPLWKLLFELLYYCKYGTIDEVTVRAYSELTTEELVVYVKQELQNLGFLSKEFCHLPNDTSSGSRELLLAFAWLLCKQNLIDKFMDNCSSPVEDSSLLHELDDKKASKEARSLIPAACRTPVQKVQQLQLLNGKLRSSLRRLYALQREKAKLQHRVHECTQGTSLTPDMPHLSSLEAHLLRHPELMNKIMILLEKDNVRLKHMQEWGEQEQVFWKWMESVLELKVKETPRHKDAPMLYYNIAPEPVPRMDEARRKLEEAILRYETIIVQIEELWETRRSEVSEEELDGLLDLLNMEISLQKSSLALGSSDFFMIRDPTFVLNKKDKKKPNLPKAMDSLQAASGQGEGLSVPVEISSEIAALESQLRLLETEVSRKTQHYTADLEKFSVKVPGSLLVQPSSCV
ncbi:tubulin epsilon and delta complex protein 1-like [Ostrea edulis]|uniref:tubulin epsilon and delta complex protein 1-like n=1 Tax=Ostrea edulis TaxID=37623 RepID=UPI0020960112|nr:tubulin epsilon and delta complex protein 1-like [Ostrea edulis]